MVRPFLAIHVLKAITDAANPRHAELSEWIGGGFDPDRVSLADINRRLSALRVKQVGARRRQREAMFFCARCERQHCVRAEFPGVLECGWGLHWTIAPSP
jgi:hypothetical protein